MHRTTSLLLSLLTIAQLAAAQTKPADSVSLVQPYRVTPRTGSQHISLSGAWQLGHLDQAVNALSELSALKEPITTQVPNSVQMSLYQAGKYPHPYYHKNSKLYFWVDEKVWYYRRNITVPASAKGNYVFLSFDGIDYFARVWVNGTLLGSHEGMFGGPAVEVSELLKYDAPNEIVVEVKAANYGNKADDIESLPRTSNGDPDYSKRKGYNPRSSGRIIKPWVIAGGTGGEMFFPLGIWQDVRLDIVPRVHIERPFLTTQQITGNEAVLSLSTEIIADTISTQLRLHPWDNRQIANFSHDNAPKYIPADGDFQLRVELMDGNQSAFRKDYPITPYKGRNWLKQEISVPNPKLWFPNGMGDPHLYQVKITLLQNGQATDQMAFDYGIRTIETMPTPGMRTVDRWEDWQFVVNGQKLFVKGVNWMPADILLDLPPERYRWLLGMAQHAGVQMIRIWGGGIIETEHFYDACNELGLMVWQDFPLGNQDATHWPQDVWEPQVVHTLARIRNHPSLAVYCGGNEFNPYSFGNAATVGILERNIDIFDGTRAFRRTTPDGGSVHTYPDIDPVWYGKLFKYVPWITETGMHNIPEASVFRETVDNKEFVGLGKMWDKSFGPSHPEFIHHFVEYGPGRVPRMLSRASHITDIADPSLDALSEASQIGAGEFYQVLSEKVQGNYPVTTGLMPWVYKRPWPVIAIQLVDGFGHPNAPYYFLKRTYEPTHIAVDLPRLLWAAGENLPVNVKITHALPNKMVGAMATVTVLDDAFKPLWEQKKEMALQAGPSVNALDLGSFTIPADYQNRYFFVIAELKDNAGKLISRQTYWPRSLTQMEDATFRQQYLNESIPWPTLEKGPWLKPTVAKTSTTTKMQVLTHESLSDSRSRIRIRVQNTGKLPACMSKLDVTGTKRALYADDNFFWLAPGETRELTAEILWREPGKRDNAEVMFAAWNAKAQTAKLPKAKAGQAMSGE